MQSFMDSPLYQRMMAQALQGNVSHNHSAVGAMGDVVGNLADAWAAKQYGDKLEKRDQAVGKTYSDAFAPQVDPTLLASQIDNQIPGTPENQAGATTQPTSQQSLAKLLSNPDVAAQLGPSMASALVQSQARANEPITPYEKANLANQADQRAYERQQADFGQLDQGSADIQKAMNDSTTVRRTEGANAAAAMKSGAEAEAKFPFEQRLATARASQADDAGWSVMQDPTNGKQFRFNARTGEARDLQNQPYQPGGAGKLNTGMPRSPATAAFMKWQSENPNASAADYAQAAGKISQTVAGGRSMGGGQDGAGILAANAVSQHIKVYEDLAQAMNNGDVQAINSARNAWQQEFGAAAPTNAEFANQIIGPELVKAIVAGGGTGAEREAMEKALSTNKSWDQAPGLTNTAKRLLGGQLAARQKKFTFNGLGKPEDFRQALEPEAQNILDQFGGSAGAPVLPNSPMAGPKRMGRFTVEQVGP